MLPDRVSNPGPLTYVSGALPIALRSPACTVEPPYNSHPWDSKKVAVVGRWPNIKYNCTLGRLKMSVIGRWLLLRVDRSWRFHCI